MIYQALKDVLMPMVKTSMPGYLLDHWNQEKLLLTVPNLNWIGPATVEVDGWDSIKKFEGNVAVLW